MDSRDSENTHPHPPERPGWMAIGAIAIFVLAAIVMYLVGVRMLRR
ncbi:MAG TPA: hypothetical protein VLX58_12595 [Bryobacteraceae bacterium]|nr:hypothetical protein [Bryobacteraceae bacterium]